MSNVLLSAVTNAPVQAGIGESFAQIAFSGSMLLAMPVALLAGLISFASPCVVPLVPGYVGFLGGLAGSQANSQAHQPSDRPQRTGEAIPPSSSTFARLKYFWAQGRGRVLMGMLLFVLGFTVVFVFTGVLTGALGIALAQWSEILTRVLGVVVALMGLAFMGVIPALQSERRLHHVPQTGLWGAPVLGFVFGLGWTPCLGPTLVAINSLALSEGSAGRGAVLAVAYSLGLGLPFILIAVGMEKSKKALSFLRIHRRAIMRIGGGLLMLLGLAMATGLWTKLSNVLSTWIGYTNTVV